MIPGNRRGYVEFLGSKMAVLFFAIALMIAFLQLYANQADFQRLDTATQVSRNIAIMVDVIYGCKESSSATLSIPERLEREGYAIEVNGTLVTTTYKGDVSSARLHVPVAAGVFTSGPLRITKRQGKVYVEAV